MIATAPAHAQMVCGADDAKNLRELQTMSGSQADFELQLHKAANWLQADSVAWLLEKGVSANSHSDKGDTPLIFLVLGADAGPEDPDASEPLPRGVKEVPWPCSTERQEAERKILAALLARSPDLEARNDYGSTALLLAAKRRRFDLVLALHDAGANINAADKTGATAIFFAPRTQLKSLVKVGADINAARSNGDTILHEKMRLYTGQRLIDFVSTAIKLGAHDSRNQGGEWASEVDGAGIYFDLPRRLDQLDSARKQIKATRPEDVPAGTSSG